MKKVIWLLLILVALASACWFVGWPVLEQFLAERQPADQLKGADEATDSFAEEGWIRQEKFIYRRRDIPSLEKEFEAIGYPPFLYLAEQDGSVGRSGEKSYHEDGMALFLYMDETWYLTHAKLEYTVPAGKFSSTAMSGNIRPFCDFAGIITGKEIKEEDRELLIRDFAELFNDADHKPRKLKLNGLEFTISLDGFYMLLVMAC